MNAAHPGFHAVTSTNFKARKTFSVTIIEPDLLHGFTVWMRENGLAAGLEAQAVRELIRIAISSTVEDAVIENAKLRVANEVRLLWRTRTDQFFAEIKHDLAQLLVTAEDARNGNQG